MVKPNESKNSRPRICGMDVAVDTVRDVTVTMGDKVVQLSGIIENRDSEIAERDNTINRMGEIMLRLKAQVREATAQDELKMGGNTDIAAAKREAMEPYRAIMTKEWDKVTRDRVDSKMRAAIEREFGLKI